MTNAVSVAVSLPQESILTQVQSAILYQILAYIIDNLEDLLYQGSEPTLTEKTHPVKQQVARLGAIFEDQLHCVGVLQTIESDAFSIEGLQDSLRDTVSLLEHTVRSIGGQATRLTAIHQHCLLQLQDKANKRLLVLTVIAAMIKIRIWLST